jgi:HrpA-like RNA helicase
MQDKQNSSVMDSQLDTYNAQNALMKMRIPQKRTFAQKRIGDSDSDEEENKRKTKSSKNEYDSDSAEEEAYKRQNTGQTMEVTELMRDQIRQSIEAAKNLPIARHRQEIIAKLEKARVLIISGDTGCGKTT